MKKILLTQDKFALVDDCDYDYLMQWKWCYHCRGYVTRTNRNNKQQRTIWMHRVILERMGFKNFARSDHINRNKLDNRRCNLRPATNSQSVHNQGKRKSNTSGYIGVSCRQNNEKWRVRIRVNGKDKSLGDYSDSKEAARVYNEAALKHRGEFAVLNKV